MANFGDILTSIDLGSKQSVRRNLDDTGFEAYATDLQTVTVRVRSSDYAGGLTKGTVVYIGGAVGNRPYVLKADADLEATSSKTFGILAQDIAANGDGLCAIEGVLVGLDLSTSNGWADGDKLWLSQTAGEFTKTVPAEPAHSVFIGTISRAHPTLGTIVVQIQNGYELNELHGVLLDDPPADGDVLTYETSSGLWKNKPLSSGAISLDRWYDDQQAGDGDTTDCYSHTIAGGTLATNGDLIRGFYAGTALSSGGFGSIAVRFDGTNYGPLSGFEVTSGDWRLDFVLIRVSATSARISITLTFVDSGTSAFKTMTSYDAITTNVTWSGSETINLRMETQPDGYLTATMGYIEYVGQ